MLSDNLAVPTSFGPGMKTQSCFCFVNQNTLEHMVTELAMAEETIPSQS